MTEKRKAAPSVTSTGSGEMETAAGSGTFSIEYDNTAAAGRQVGYVEALLPQGEARAIPTVALVALCGYRSARELQKEVERERLAGALILSKGGSGGGYFLPDDGDAGHREIAAFVRTVNARAVNSLRTLETARRALKAIDGQMAMGDY